MRKVLLRPSWILTALAVALFTAACFGILAPWQMNRAEAARQQNAILHDSTAGTSPAALTDVLGPDGAVAPGDEWREVAVEGRYLDAGEIQLRNQPTAGKTRTHLLTPFRVAHTQIVVLVDRGFVAEDGHPAVNAGDPAVLGETTIHARLRAADTASRFTPARIDDGAVIVYAVDPAQVADATGLALAPYYLQLSAGQPGSLGELPLPVADAGGHVSYAVQWMVLGALAPLGLAVVSYRRVRYRREPAGDPRRGLVTRSAVRAVPRE